MNKCKKDSFSWPIAWSVGVAFTIGGWSQTLPSSLAEPFAAPPGARPMVRVAETRSVMKAAEFVLEDQYQQTQTYHFPRDKVSFLVLADYHGSDQLEAWIHPVHQRYEKRIEIDGVAVVHIVPAALRGMVRGLFKKRLAYPVMLDWQGTVSQSYGYQPGIANLFVIDRQGHVRFRTAGPCHDDELQQVFRSIDFLMREGK